MQLNRRRPDGLRKPNEADPFGSLSVLPGHRLAITFRDGTQGIADFSSIGTSQNPGIYAPLADESYFAQAALELGIVLWPNGADIAPSWAYENLEGGKAWSVPV